MPRTPLAQRARPILVQSHDGAGFSEALKTPLQFASRFQSGAEREENPVSRTDPLLSVHRQRQVRNEHQAIAPPRRDVEKKGTSIHPPTIPPTHSRADASA
jgi:hypothetical protein